MSKATGARIAVTDCGSRSSTNNPGIHSDLPLASPWSERPRVSAPIQHSGAEEVTTGQVWGPTGPTQGQD